MSDPFSGPDDDAKRGRALAELGMSLAAAASGPWFPQAQLTLMRICQLCGGMTATGEGLGNAVTTYYCAPSRPQAWGALISWAIKQKLIIVTGDRHRMKKPSSHARKTDVYRIL